ncbi:MAG: hypothetical protein ACYSW3_02170 [Planctomycetota bacterium]|jgi:hypothetical protein
MSDLARNEDIRIAQVLEVMGIIFADPRTKVDVACEKVGIKPSTYYYWVRKDPEALRAVREFLAETQKVELAFLSAAVSEINMELAATAMSENTEAADRLRIAKYLSNEAEKLQRVYQVTGGSEEAAEFLKDGPKLEKHSSRFASMTVAEDGDGKVKVDFYREDTVIDGDVAEFDSLDEPE